MNKILPFLIIFLCGVAFAEDYVCYDSNDVYSGYLKSIDPSSKPDNCYYVSNAEKPEVKIVIQETPSKYLKRGDNDLPEIMSQQEIDAVDAEEAQAILDAQISAAEALEGKLENVLIALVKVINKRIPTNRITRAEIVQQYKEDQGLA